MKKSLGELIIEAQMSFEEKNPDARYFAIQDTNLNLLFEKVDGKWISIPTNSLKTK